jgi:hypothetical protein
MLPLNLPVLHRLENNLTLAGEHKLAGWMRRYRLERFGLN